MRAFQALPMEMWYGIRLENHSRKARVEIERKRQRGKDYGNCSNRGCFY